MYHIFDRSTFEFHEFPGKIMKYKSFLHQKTTEHSKSLQNILAFTMINCVKKLTKILISHIGDDSTALLI